MGGAPDRQMDRQEWRNEQLSDGVRDFLQSRRKGGTVLEMRSLCLCTLQACGVDFEVKSFCAENLEDKIPKRYPLALSKIAASQMCQETDLFSGQKQPYF